MNTSIANAIENMASKKFGVIFAVGYVLWDASEKHPADALIYLSMMCGMAILYSGLELYDKHSEQKNETH